jgi:hypothetical protein
VVPGKSLKSTVTSQRRKRPPRIHARVALTVGEILSSPSGATSARPHVPRARERCRAPCASRPDGSVRDIVFTCSSSGGRRHRGDRSVAAEACGPTPDSQAAEEEEGRRGGGARVGAVHRANEPTHVPAGSTPDHAEQDTWIDRGGQELAQDSPRRGPPEDPGGHHVRRSEEAGSHARPRRPPRSRVLRGWIRCRVHETLPSRRGERRLLDRPVLESLPASSPAPPRRWVPGHYETICRPVYVAGCEERTWVPAAYGWVRDRYGRTFWACGSRATSR